jgi:hypothetical protein
MLRKSGLGVAAALLGGLLAAGTPGRAQDDQAIGFERTPPRLSLTDGEVSFWRPGAEDWTPARVNTPLAEGDELYTARGSNLELQIGARAYVRAGEETQLGLANLEPDFLQLRVTTGYISLDLRSRKASQTIELDTPNAAFTVEHTGYYRLEVDGETTTFISRRGGRATVTTATGASAAIAPSEQVVVSGADAPQIGTYSAPELDAWDRWNYARSDLQIDALSARYVSSNVYGADDLDHYGDWRVVPSYGAVWVPRGVAVGWAPYSTGRWIYDPFYSWTWVDDAPWGWAPYHYGRWVYVSGFWGWCPGPIVVRPYYAPALVAFFGGGDFSIGISLGRPHLGWVALGWGEPLVPWWGSVGFRAAPRWAGWGGPRVVNKVVVKRNTVINVREINVYQNAHERNAMVAVDRSHFGRRSIAEARATRADAEKFKPLRGDFPVKPDRASLVAADGPAKRPPHETLLRSVVATRAPRAAPVLKPESRRAAQQAEHEDRKAGVPRAESALPPATPPTRVVQPPREGQPTVVSKRPPFGQQGEAERLPPPAPPRFRDVERKEAEERGAGRLLDRGTKPGKAPVAPAERGAAGERLPRAERPQASPPERKKQAEATRPAPLPQERPSEASAPAPAPQLPHPGVQQERAERAQPKGKAVSRRDEQASPPARNLPGEPANRVYRKRAGSMSREVERAPAPRDVKTPVRR